MDETPMFFDMPNSKTYDVRGAKTVRRRSTRYEKLPYSVVLAYSRTMKNAKDLNFHQ